MRSIVLALTVLLAWMAGATAHVLSTGLATLDVAGDKLTYRLTVTAAQLDEDPGRFLIAAANGQADAAARLANLTRQHARFSLNGLPCRPGDVAVRRGVESKVVLEMPLICAAATGRLVMRDDWYETMGGHFKTVLSVRVPGRTSSEFVFFENDREAWLDLAAPAAASWPGFVKLGVEHILGGIDHLCFLLALLALSQSLWSTVKIVTGFTVAHSITLSLAAFGLVNVPAHIVEPLIAASIVWVAIENLVAPASAGRRWLVAAVFGLVHGLGFATALEELHLARESLVSALLGFNLGVELGQVAVVALVMPLVIWASRPAHLPRLPQFLSAAVALAGMGWFVERVLA